MRENPVFHLTLPSPLPLLSSLSLFLLASLSIGYINLAVNRLACSFIRLSARPKNLTQTAHKYGQQYETAATA